MNKFTFGNVMSFFLINWELTELIIIGSENTYPRNYVSQNPRKCIMETSSPLWHYTGLHWSCSQNSFNDLSTITKYCLLVQCAGDSQYVHSPLKKIQLCLSKVKRYFSVNGLKLNTYKMQRTFIDSRQNIAKIRRLLYQTRYT